MKHILTGLDHETPEKLGDMLGVEVTTNSTAQDILYDNSW